MFATTAPFRLGDCGEAVSVTKEKFLAVP